MRTLDGVADHDPTALRSGHGTTDHDEAAFYVDLGHFEILGGDVVHTVMAVHLFVLEGPA